MKKLICILLSAIMMFSGMVFAQGAEEDFKTAITAVKSAMEIPEDCTDFQYSSYENEDGVTVWHLSWEDEQYNSGVRADVTTDGRILSLNKYNYNEVYAELSKVDFAQANATALEFLKKILGDEAAKYKIISTDGRYGTISVKLIKSVNDILVKNSEITVEINKSNGEAESYYNYFTDTETEYESTETVISTEAAQKYFLDNIGIKLTYKSNYDFKSKKLNVYPAYTINDVYKYAVSAKDGSVVDIDKEYNAGDVTAAENSAVMADKDSGGGASFSREEIQAIENVGDLLTRDEASQKLKSYINKFPSDVKLVSANLFRNYIQKTQYVWNLYFSNDKGAYVSGGVDAKTGELLNYSIGFDENKKEQKISYDKALEKVKEFAQRVSAEKFKNTQLSEREYTVSPLKNDEKADESMQSYYFSRIVNGIEYEDNGISAEYDASRGMITDYNVTWNDNAEFPPIDKVMTAEEIMPAAVEKCNFGLMYYNGSLIYGFYDSRNISFDPFSGKQLDYSGKELSEDKDPEYTDISGHWCEKYVKKLAENGYYKYGDMFKPDEEISTLDFFRYVLNYDKSISDEELKENIISSYLSENEISDKITRKTAAKVFANILGCSELADKWEYFNYPFADAAENAYKGYITVCKAFGIISGDENNCFNADKNITNAQVAVMIYNLKVR